MTRKEARLIRSMAGHLEDYEKALSTLSETTRGTICDLMAQRDLVTVWTQIQRVKHTLDLVVELTGTNPKG